MGCPRCVVGDAAQIASVRRGKFSHCSKQVSGPITGDKRHFEGSLRPMLWYCTKVEEGGWNRERDLVEVPVGGFVRLRVQVSGSPASNAGGGSCNNVPMELRRRP